MTDRVEIVASRRPYVDGQFVGSGSAFDADPTTREGVFGPAATVHGYADVDEAVAVADDLPFGLSGGVRTDDPDHRMSGLGREWGVAGIGAFQQHISVGSS
ncbi:aldehyde dehydrogenase family protein [Streptodolium elevatio]